ncbi:MAG: hypothetical protein NZ519_04000 [Bacteroidia bacterium]|nr:hypothetical protein [Bacteroidia bacterium]MDW8302092.1 hypothetical protein [Bacteroidia bacterium]
MKFSIYSTWLILVLVLYCSCRKQPQTPSAHFKLEVAPQIFPAASTLGDTLQAKIGAICIIDITVHKGKSPIKQISVTRINLSTSTSQILKDTLYNTQNQVVKISISSNLGNISTFWRYEVIAKDESENFLKKIIHIRVGQNCPSLILNFVGFTSADSNRVKVQASGLPSGTIYQYSYDNGISWTYSNEFTFKTSGIKAIYARDKNNPACVASLVVNVTGKKIYTHTIELGAQMNTVYPHFYDVETKTTHFYSTAFAYQNVIDWVYHTYASSTYLFSPKSAADSNYYNMNTWTTRLQSKFFNPVWVGEYNNAISSVEIKAAQRGPQKDVSPALYYQICIPFIAVNASNIVKANGIAYIKEFEPGPSGHATIELKYYLLP